MTNTIQELRDAEVILALGTNMTEAHPAISYVVKQAVAKGATLIVVDPRRPDLCRWAAHHVPIRLGSDIAFVNALIHEVFVNGWADEEFLREHTENPDAMRAWAADWTPERASAICGVPAAQIREIARILGTAGSASVCYTLGITEHVCGTDNVKTLANLQMALGNIGSRGAGLNPLRGQNNVQGACDMGALPNVFHNYQAVTDPAAVAKMEAAWGVTGMSNRPGLKMPTMIRRALDGGTRALWCLADNPVQAEPHMAHTRKALAALELLVVVDIFPNVTTPFAHVVLPDTAWGEEDGTFTNSERRVQRVRRALAPPGSSRPSWWMLQEIGLRLGHDLGFTSAAAIWEDMRRTATGYAGITWDRIDSLGIQWPCPTAEHPGTPILHAGGKFTRGKGLFAKTDWVPPAELPDAAYPIALTTGRRLWHYHTRTQTSNCEGLETLCPEELLEIHADDAARLGIAHGDVVRASSRRGAVTLRAWISRRVPPGVAWMAFHFAEACANELTIDAYDPVAETAEYKVCAIRVERVGASAEPLSAVLRQARP